jgi:adenylate cyclase
MTKQSGTRGVVFADVSESSALYQKLGDTAARKIINATLAALNDLLPRFHGVLVKTLGDAVMCVFPSADLAVLAASEMQAVVTNDRPGNFPVAIHIGVAFGPVLLEDADVFGDTVNVAAYLTAVAMPEQILATHALESALSPALKSCIRPVFHAVLKGSDTESVVHQVLWKTDRMEITDVNFQSHKIIPGDTGSLVVSLDEERVRIDQWRPEISIGRGASCDLVVSDRYASRQHLTIRLTRTRFYLIDHSINGTFVTFTGANEELHVLRQDLPLDRSGRMSLGRSGAGRSEGAITFNYDRRSMFRI